MQSKTQTLHTGQTLETRMLSELLILDVLSRLGQVRIPQLVIYLKQATEKSRVPFFLGTTVRDVLREHERIKHIESASAGTDSLYTITQLGRKQLAQYQQVVEKFYPSVLKVEGHKPAASSTALRG
jgi:hypothetical protein